MIAAAVQGREVTDAELLHQALAPLTAHVSAGAQSTGRLANISFLVDRLSVEQFLASIEEFRQQHQHLGLRVNGPLPPCSFVDSLSSEQTDGGTAQTFWAGPSRAPPDRTPPSRTDDAGRVPPPKAHGEPDAAFGSAAAAYLH